MKPLSDEHGYVQLVRETRHLSHGPNRVWVDRFLAASLQTRRRMLSRQAAARAVRRSKRSSS